MARSCKRLSITCKGGKTKSAPANDCDINTIIARAKKSGVLPMAQRTAQYADVSNVPDAHTAMCAVKRLTPEQVRAAVLPGEMKPKGEPAEKADKSESKNSAPPKQEGKEEKKDA